MKNISQLSLMVIVLFLCLSQTAWCQKTNKSKLYRAWVKPNEGGKNIANGYLEGIEKDYLLISHWKTGETKQVDIKGINYVEFRKEGRVERGLIYGFLGGGVLGTLIGATKKADNRLAYGKEFQVIGYGATGATLGSLIGLLVGSTTTRIPINGHMSDVKRKVLDKYRLVD